MTDAEITAGIVELLRTPVLFHDVLARFETESYRAVLRSWGAVREAHVLERDEVGRYVMR